MSNGAAEQQSNGATEKRRNGVAQLEHGVHMVSLALFEHIVVLSWLNLNTLYHPAQFEHIVFC